MALDLGMASEKKDCEFPKCAKQDIIQSKMFAQSGMSVSGFKCYQRYTKKHAEQKELMMNSQKTGLIRIMMYFHAVLGMKK